ncbi:MAG: hypothetical protein P4L86_29635 [Mycobacterium sp.]|nr:hypothetical protein [Mycobacterium sp.]
MRSDDAVPLRYLVEWYTPHLHGRAIADIAQCLRRSLDAMPTPAHSPALLYALEVPQDAYAFGVFSADSADAVAQACEQAGLPADRVSAAVEAPSAPSAL